MATSSQGKQVDEKKDEDYLLAGATWVNILFQGVQFAGEQMSIANMHSLIEKVKETLTLEINADTLEGLAQKCAVDTAKWQKTMDEALSRLRSSDEAMANMGGDMTDLAPLFKEISKNATEYQEAKRKLAELAKQSETCQVEKQQCDQIVKAAKGKFNTKKEKILKKIEDDRVRAVNYLVLFRLVLNSLNCYFEFSHLQKQWRHIENAKSIQLTDNARTNIQDDFRKLRLALDEMESILLKDGDIRKITPIEQLKLISLQGTVNDLKQEINDLINTATTKINGSILTLQQIRDDAFDNWVRNGVAGILQGVSTLQNASMVHWGLTVWGGALSAAFGYVAYENRENGKKAQIEIKRLQALLKEYDDWRRKMRKFNGQMKRIKNAINKTYKAAKPAQPAQATSLRQPPPARMGFSGIRSN